MSAMLTTEKIRELVDIADSRFEEVGGSSRHWVRDCFFPVLEQNNMRLITDEEDDVSPSVRVVRAVRKADLSYAEDGSTGDWLVDYFLPALTEEHVAFDAAWAPGLGVWGPP